VHLLDTLHAFTGVTRVLDYAVKLTVCACILFDTAVDACACCGLGAISDGICSVKVGLLVHKTTYD